MTRQGALTARTLFQTIFSGLLIVSSVIVIQAQGPTSSAPLVKKVTSSTPKVWTNDDLQSLRKPWAYEDQKATAEGAAGKAGAESPAKAAAAEATPNPGNSEVAMPKTLEETNQRIDQTTKGIRNRELMIRGVEDALNIAPEEQRLELQRQIDLMKSKVEDEKEELKILQAHRQELEELTAKLNRERGSPQ